MFHQWLTGKAYNLRDGRFLCSCCTAITQTSNGKAICPAYVDQPLTSSMMMALIEASGVPACTNRSHAICSTISVGLPPASSTHSNATQCDLCQELYFRELTLIWNLSSCIESAGGTRHSSVVTPATMRFSFLYACPVSNPNRLGKLELALVRNHSGLFFHSSGGTFRQNENSVNTCVVQSESVVVILRALRRRLAIAGDYIRG